MKKYTYICDMASIHIMVDGGSLYFDNHFGDGIYNVYLCKKKEVPKRAEFQGQFIISKEGWLMKLDCSFEEKDKQYKFPKGRYFVYLNEETCDFYIYRLDDMGAK